MSESIRKVLDEINRADSYEKVMSSPQTEVEDGKVISLDISDLQLNSLPEDLFQSLNGIKRIHASFNNLKSLPEKLFKGLDSLEFVNFYGNKIERLPDNIFEGLELEWIDLRSNKLEAIPKSLGTQDNLNYLFLQNNPLSEHPDKGWAADYHSKRDVKKIIPEIQEEFGLEVTMEKPLTREERARRAKKRREQKQKEG